MTVSWGLLSTARINDEILAAARETDAAAVVAVASRDRDRAEASAREHGIERAHGSYEALLADPGVEAVYVSLPNGMHVEWSTRALEAGKHVLVEKPLSRRRHEVEKLFDLAASKQLVVSEGFMWRHHPQTAKLVELVETGTIGRLRLVRAGFSFILDDPGDVRLSADLDGGALMDLGCYCLSALRLLAGEPLRLSGEQTLGPTGVDVSYVGTAAFEHEIMGHFDCSFVLPRRSELEVAGEAGVLFLSDPWTIRTPGIEIRRQGAEPERVDVPRVSSYRLELDNISAAIRGEKPLLLGRDDAVGQARTIETLYRSAETAAGVG
jgi:xylose dehydrogenase (NAD/NADP)